MTAATIQDIVAGISAKQIVLVVARAVDIGRTIEPELLDPGWHDKADLGRDDIRATSAVFDHDIADIVDKIFVGLVAAYHGVGTGAAIEHVAAHQDVVAVTAIDAAGPGGAAGDRVVAVKTLYIAVCKGAATINHDDIVLGIPGSSIGIQQMQVLDIVGQAVKCSARHDGGIDTAIGKFDKVIGDVISDIDKVAIVTGAARHGILAAAVAERIVAGIAIQDVIVQIAGCIDIRGTGQGQINDASAQGVGNAAVNLVAVVVTAADDLVADIVDIEDAAAAAAHHDIGAFAAIKDIVTGSARQAVVAAITDKVVVELVAARTGIARARQRQVLDIEGQGVGDA